MACALRLSPTCRREWDIEERLANETRAKNDGRMICQFCSIAAKRPGRTNPNTKSRDLDDRLFETVDSEAKAYVLGWIASDGAIRTSTISLHIHEQDRATLARLRDVVCPALPLRPKKPRLVGFTINSQRIVRDVCRWLEIEPGKKAAGVGFPKLSSEALQWAFLRGMFDGDGSISSIDASTRRATQEGSGWPAPRCAIATTSAKLLDEIASFSRVPAHRGKQAIEWNGSNALDFLGRLYGGATLFRPRNHDAYLDWCSWVPAIRSTTPPHPLFRWARTLAEAVPPSKAAISDSGFDLTLVERAHRHGAVEFFRTGIKVQPAFGWYFDLVPRSSIAKTGYMLANGIGIIDRGYTGEILVPLIKVDQAATELKLPIRLVQIIPRQIIAAELVEVGDFDETSRGAGGFGSTG